MPPDENAPNRRIVPLDDFLYNVEGKDTFHLDLPLYGFQESALLIVAARALQVGMGQAKDSHHQAVVLKLHELPERLFAGVDADALVGRLMDGRYVRQDHMSRNVMPLVEHMRVLMGRSGVLPVVALTFSNSVASIISKVLARAGVLHLLDMCTPILGDDAQVLLADVLALYAGVQCYVFAGADLDGSLAEPSNVVIGNEMLSKMLSKGDGKGSSGDSIERRLEMAMAYIAATDGIRSEVSLYFRNGRFEKAVFSDITF
ncbi:MAG: hypothetical protein LBR22_04035 [Desulfovibrio sp.]|jgi:hypothetical protein|nr:hypothetical protein [Desulfovibrio sp.]